MNRLDQLRAMAIEDPDNSFIAFAIAMEYKTNDELEKATEEFEKLKKNDPDYVGLYYHLAECYAEMDDLQNAMSTYEKGISVAESLKDHHAKAELLNAKVNLEMEL